MNEINWLNSERRILERIASDERDLASTISFALRAAFPWPEREFGQDVMLAINVPRTVLGLPANMKPGDIDYLIVPRRKNRLLLHRSIATEAKVVRPSLHNPSRSTNSMGRSQTIGLLRDGFPFVGLVHIAVPEPLPKKFLQRIPLKACRPGSNGDLVETGEYMDLDPFPYFCARRQEGRLLALNLPKEVSLKAVAFTFSSEYQRFSGYTMNESRIGTKNPATCPTLIKNIGWLVRNYPEMFTSIRWFKSTVP